MMPMLSGIGCFFLYGCSMQEARAWDWDAKCRRRSNRGAGGKGRARCSKGGPSLVSRGGMIAVSGLKRVRVYNCWDMDAEGTVGRRSKTRVQGRGSGLGAGLVQGQGSGARQLIWARGRGGCRPLQVAACSGAAVGAQVAGLGVWARRVASKGEQKRAGQGEQSKGNLGCREGKTLFF
ncbi:hypothetical protein SLEP1_g53336 [Rubroshorea leprosula]|uniref:Uncharacterized protein n=1 Tax=Rubroshorea leprosula TaxID=152421 RepID=A0AAV5M991_9ROSI|nr:hypothetical protein SLEP1_g53336 [Rubroshorea leprosula]